MGTSAAACPLRVARVIETAADPVERTVDSGHHWAYAMTYGYEEN
jgi:hypothetical protein